MTGWRMCHRVKYICWGINYLLMQIVWLICQLEQQTIIVTTIIIYPFLQISTTECVTNNNEGSHCFYLCITSDCRSSTEENNIHQWWEFIECRIPGNTDPRHAKPVFVCFGKFLLQGSKDNCRGIMKAIFSLLQLSPVPGQLPGSEWH